MGECVRGRNGPIYTRVAVCEHGSGVRIPPPPFVDKSAPLDVASTERGCNLTGTVGTRPGRQPEWYEPRCLKSRKVGNRGVSKWMRQSQLRTRLFW